MQRYFVLEMGPENKATGRYCIREAATDYAACLAAPYQVCIAFEVQQGETTPTEPYKRWLQSPVVQV